MHSIKRLLCMICVLCLCPFVSMAENEADTPEFLYPIGVAVGGHPIEYGYWGYMNAVGDVVIDPVWGWVDSFTDDVACTFEENGSGRYLINRQGETVLGPMPEIERNAISYTVIDEQGRRGIYDIASNQYIVSDYGDIYDQYSTDPASTRLLVIAKDESCYGYLDRATGELVIPMVYDEMPHDYTKGSYFEHLSSECSQAVFSGGYAYVNKRSQDASAVTNFLIDEAGNPVVFPEGLEPLSPVQDGSRVIVGRYFHKGEGSSSYALRGLAKIQEGKVEILVEPKYTDHRLFTNGYAAMFLQTAFPFIDLDGKEAVAMQDTVTFIDLDGQEMMEPVDFFAYERSEPVLVDGYFYQVGNFEDFSVLYHIDQGAILRLDDIRLGYLDPGQDVMVSHSITPGFLLAMDGRVKARFDFLNQFFEPSWNGPIYYEYPYSFFAYEPGKVVGSQYFNEGLQAACVTDESGKEKYGFINTEGEFVLEPQWDCAGNFLNGLAMVLQDDIVMYINHEGQVIWSSEDYADFDWE